MKRGRNSTVSDSNTKRGRTKTGEVSHIQTQYPGSLFSDLPKDILVNILLRLSVRRILVCKCVCKTWYDLVSDPEFAKIHFDQAQVCPLIRKFHSRMVYLVQPDKDDFELKLGMCDHSHSKSGCVCNVQVKLDKFKVLERNECIKLKTKDHSYKYSIVNSCNGLLCFFDPSDRRPPMVGNPITGEYVDLPEATKVDLHWNHMQYGLGFSPASNQYKVIRMFQRGTRNMAQVHILGTNTWHNIAFFTQKNPKSFPVYLNGFLCWLSGLKPLSVFTFDIENEHIGSVSAPTGDQRYLYGSVGVLEGELCISGVLKSGSIHVWALKDYSTEKAWSKVFSFDMYPYPTRHYGPFKPIKYLNDGALLMFHSYGDLIGMEPKDALLYMDPERNRLRFLNILGVESEVEITAHTPSFVSLKHALSGQNLKVHNVAARCAELKVHKEAKDLTIVEEEFHPDPDDPDPVSDSDFSAHSDTDSTSHSDMDSSCDSAGCYLSSDSDFSSLSDFADSYPSSDSESNSNSNSYL